MALSWLHLSILSGLCAATNGLFAKLTTTSLTSSLAGHISTHPFVEPVVRAAFFGLNLLFNAVMWTFFTAALKRGDSATRVSVVNTAANFMATALFGAMVFSEKLTPTWCAGAALLVGGSVVISRRDDDKEQGGYEAVASEEMEGTIVDEDAEGRSSGSGYEDDGEARRRSGL